MIRKAIPSDCVQIAEIYNDYILNSTATFEIAPINPTDIEHRLANAHCFLVYEEASRVLGYAYAAKYHPRAAYRYTAECSIYLRTGEASRGLGTALYEKLFIDAKAFGIREMVAVIALPNSGSEALHKKLGFRRVGVVERCGIKFGQVIDTSIWQRSLLEPNTSL